MAVKKIHELTNEALTANDDDFFVIDVDNGDGSYTTKKIKKSNIPTGTNSAPLTKTGQTTSYRTGDDGDIEAGRAVDFFTLDFTNFFGNTNRFTDTLGGQTYANNIVLDWSTFNSNTGDVLGYDRNAVNLTALDWNNSIDFCLAHSVGGFTSGWRLANLRELENIKAQQGGWAYNYPPFNITSFYFWSSTTSALDTTQAFIVGLDGSTIRYGKTLPVNPFPVRTFNISEL